ncbi:MAG: glutathione S-transferase, partial [Alphaproteobacteria bacterium]|nr:glutathione S-transferase [Alphaproteobacteria bacterium]
MIYLCGFGVSNYYNKLKFVLLEKRIEFEERLSYPWDREAFLSASPLGRIPYIETDQGCLSESQAALEYLEDAFPDIPLYPADAFARAKCRELIQHIELNSEWVARRLYKEAFFGGVVSEETKSEAYQKLALGLC